MHTISPGRHIRYGSLCPKIRQPHRDCYCYNITSQKILNVLRFCGSNYEKCKMYQSNNVFEVALPEATGIASNFELAT
ncbi:MAG: hypothetical protein PHY09_16965 [Desulfuromonadaceae bacterium]|nr:hypothetical protein [Desulfuromonadaceae bacterium]MDD5106449.1 hypothetical protein [Desulfuromonadaceae bacterium]